VAAAGVQAEVADELIGIRERVSLFNGRLEAPHLELSREFARDDEILLTSDDKNSPGW